MNFSSCTGATPSHHRRVAQPEALLAALTTCLFYLSGLPAVAAGATAATAADGGASATSGGMLQVMLGLGLVLALIAGCAWLLRRFGGFQASSAGAVKVIGGSPVGQRERVVLVEVADTWLVIGVAPGSVTALHSMPKGDIAEQENNTGPRPNFSRWLRQVKEKRDAGQHIG
ncbi:flagellar protein FliO/FliZ [Nitrosospira sp. Nsp2]|uniref:flagellar biosynthetic protein FliO n=1 Tax=Nitrosospira sp. Nsp2 TaxID=136548 RepID=UPI000D2FCF40|nr:flagellar biosynthetic protein FliO [Nitrosospira sp. Nsp2]PTR16401.1 flagellar protein FliO/FliZ [Nitrosospira sp. Nsp2]